MAGKVAGAPGAGQTSDRMVDARPGVTVALVLRCVEGVLPGCGAAVSSPAYAVRRGGADRGLFTSTVLYCPSMPGCCQDLTS